jgi:hypothetical protein
MYQFMAIHDTPKNRLVMSYQSEPQIVKERSRLIYELMWYNVARIACDGQKKI